MDAQIKQKLLVLHFDTEEIMNFLLSDTATRFFFFVCVEKAQKTIEPNVKFVKEVTGGFDERRKKRLLNFLKWMRFCYSNSTHLTFLNCLHPLKLFKYLTKI